MNKTQDLRAERQQLRTTRSRFHYKPISLPEFVLITTLSIFVGVGMFMLTTTIDVPQNDIDRQARSKTVVTYKV